ncbi:hypothetical protein WN48_04946 [Eufriesea mexicana]|uniref:Uncharacterized protein n=1 Tax=Eufriesea mexicana TaxID=516756 RepID=A0A310SJ29_9HYME|nr:hypothetical protein WN48_04946 [Eufriesea mexicana]
MRPDLVPGASLSVAPSSRQRVHTILACEPAQRFTVQRMDVQPNGEQTKTRRKNAFTGTNR